MEDGRFIELISTRLQVSAHPVEQPDAQLIRAAVLIPLYFEQGEWKLLFIHRSDAGELHRGEVAFPGGAVEPIDSDIVQTALRETQEELGIDSSAIRVLGQLLQMPTVTHYAVTPVVGLLQWPVALSISTAEVKRAFAIPLDWLMDEKNWKEELFETPDHRRIPTIMYDLYDGERLWGFTAKVTQIFCSLIKTESGK